MDTPPGYDKLAKVMSNDGDLAMFRRFSPLCTKTLLYMQAEILHLESQLKQEVDDDLNSGNDKGKEFAVYWKALDEAPDNGFGNWQKQYVSTIRTKLREYYEFLLLTARVSGLSKPCTSDYQYLNQWLERPVGGNGFLQGIESKVLLPKYESDLVLSSQNPSQGDQFAQFVIDRILPWYHRVVGERLQKPVSSPDMLDSWCYRKSRFTVLGDVICMLLSFFVPTVSIFVLYHQRSTVARLSIITAMSFVCSVAMTFVVRGRRVDVFAATTAFAAVQVVFLSGPNSQNCPSSA